MGTLRRDRTDEHFSHFNGIKGHPEDLIRRKRNGANPVWLLKRGDHTEELSKERAEALEEKYAEERGDGTPYIVQNN